MTILYHDIKISWQFDIMILKHHDDTMILKHRGDMIS